MKPQVIVISEHIIFKTVSIRPTQRVERESSEADCKYFVACAYMKGEVVPELN
jgi:hypothetical protein